ncbi:Cytoplasmic and mitochondrial histidine tRNA synthetase [Coemansia javaensis]|uniref:histidine--tRNA ligase n=1 Tax=Coemansia javaensis TaxID=2761396 RepID=A0A9W8H3G0_9FUNG|nr:Cytoplasmic and mitochondrial histidine tRNA synthetase [Coemansia javaensis]
MSGAEDLCRQIEEQGARVRQLKAEQADKEQIGAEVALLVELKEKLRIATGQPEPAKKGSGKTITVKTPKGTKDYTAREMAVRSEIFGKIVGVFERHGAVTIDTPVFELKEILTGKYGEDSKLIYDLKDQGGEECSLRYDLTVPFARHVAQEGIKKIKRYHIARVYRRDQPAMTKGRMREFYQCDFDIAGVYDAMIPDAECVRVAVEVLSSLDVGAFVIKINHRKILDAVFAVSGVPEDKIRPISSAVDKLDKLPWADVRREMTEEKGLSGEAADRIGAYVQLRGGPELLDTLRAMPELMANKSAQEGVADMDLFFRYAAIYNVLDRVSFDMGLARGLDYYTGIIYEAVLVDESERPAVAQPTAARAAGDGADVDESQVRVGSIAAGGRYDELVGMFLASGRGKKRAKDEVPCVGISFGVERISSIVMKRRGDQAIKTNKTAVYVVAPQGGLLEERMRIATELWDSGIATEFAYKAKPSLASQFVACGADVIPWAVFVGKDELERGVVRIKSMAAQDKAQGAGVEVPRADLVAELQKRLGA